jgi:hypothetical protein
MNMPIYETTIRNKFICTGAKTFDEFIDCLEEHVEMLKAMATDGVTLEVDGISDDYAQLTTEDPVVAARYGMEREDLEEIIEKDMSIAPVKAFDPTTGELIATGNGLEEVRVALKERPATIRGFLNIRLPRSL